MKKIISILLILTQTSILFADTLTFNNGVTIEGKLVKYDEDYLIFKVDEESMKDIPNEFVIGFIAPKKSSEEILHTKGVIVDENQVVFNIKFVKNITENNIIVANPEEERRNGWFHKFIKDLPFFTLGCGSLIGLFLWGLSDVPGF